jgi:hypothetical protein
LSACRLEVSAARPATVWCRCKCGPATTSVGRTTAPSSPSTRQSRAPATERTSPRFFGHATPRADSLAHVLPESPQGGGTSQVGHRTTQSLLFTNGPEKAITCGLYGIIVDGNHSVACPVFLARSSSAGHRGVLSGDGGPWLLPGSQRIRSRRGNAFRLGMAVRTVWACRPFRRLTTEGASGHGR